MPVKLPSELAIAKGVSHGGKTGHKDQGQEKQTTEEGQKAKTNVFRQRLGSLTFYQASQMLGDDGAKLIRAGAAHFDVQPDRDVFLGGDLFRVRVEDASLSNRLAIATITLKSNRAKQLQSNCDQCELPCEHLGAALEYLLDAKSTLGLAMPPDESVPLENLTTEELLERAMAEQLVGDFRAGTTQQYRLLGE